MAPATNQDTALALCRRLCDAVLAHPFVSGGARISVSLSVGTVTSVEGMTRSYEDLMGIVEQRTRAARFAGGNRVVASEDGALSVAALSQDAPQDDASQEVSTPATPLDEPVPALPELTDDAGFSFVEELSLESPQDMSAPVTRSEGGLDFEPTELSDLDMCGLEVDLDTALNDMIIATSPADPSAADNSPEFVGLDAALLKLARGEGDSIEPWLDSIVRRMLPLLEFYSDRRQGVLAAGIADIKLRCLS